MTKQTENRLAEIEARLTKAVEILPNQLGCNLTMDQKKFILNAISDIKFLLDKAKSIEDDIPNLYDDMDCLYDSILGLYGISFEYDKLVEVVDNLPKNITSAALQWGLSDSVVRDDIYVYLRDNPSFIKKFE